MKKIYIVAQSYAENKGSFSGFIEKVSKYYKNQGYEAKIVCGKLKNSEPDFHRTEYAEIIRFNRNTFPLFNSFFNALTLAKNIKRYFKNAGDGIIIANGESALGLYGKKFFLRAGDQPVLTYLKNMEIAKKEISVLSRIARFVHSMLLYCLEEKYFKWPIGVIYSSDETRRLFEKEYNTKKPYFIPHAGVEKVSGKHSKMNKTERLILFISYGKEKVRKGIIYLERALPRIFAKYKDVKLLHVGEKIDWNMPDWCKERIISVGIVKWNEMKKYYAKSDFLVSCSLHEMFPNTIIEAMAAGLPVVTSDIQGAKEYIEHNKTGFIYKRGNVSELEEGMINLLEKKNKIYEKDIKNKVKKITYTSYISSLFIFIKRAPTDNKLRINLLS